MSKLQDKIAEYERLREDVLAFAKGIPTQEKRVKDSTEFLAGMRKDLASKKRRLVDLSNEIPPLFHADVSGVVGNVEEPPVSSSESAS